MTQHLIPRQVQAQQQAGHTKLTAISIYHSGRHQQIFAMCLHNERGEAIIPQEVLDRHLARLGVRRGDCYSIS